MGYSTSFEGELKFTRELKASEIVALKKYLGQDRRNIGYADPTIYKNGKYGSYWYHIDYELNDDLTGIRWNQREKSYEMEYIAQWLIDEMRKVIPDFGLEGRMSAQGEDVDDRWVLIASGEGVVKHEVVISGPKIICPHCEGVVIVEEAEQA